MSFAAALPEPLFPVASVPPPFVMLAEPFLFVVVRYRGLPLGCHLLSALADDRGPSGRLTVGQGKRAQAPADPCFLLPAHDDHDLLVAEGSGFRLQLPAMATVVVREGVDSPSHAVRARDLPQLFRLGDGQLTVELDAITIEISRSESATRLALASWLFNMTRDEAASHGTSFLFLLLCMLVLRMVPSDPHALSFDLLDSPRRQLPWMLIPARLPDVPAPGQNPTPTLASDPEKTASTVGSTQIQRARAYAPQPQSVRRGSPTSASDAITQARESGLLPMLTTANASWVAVVGKGDPTLGDDAESVLKDLRGPIVGGDMVPGGLGTSGTGSKGAGTGGGLRGGGDGLLAIGDGKTGGGNGHYGRNVGHLGTRRPAVVDVIPCQISKGCQVAGSLDKEIIRRVIRRHINEIRYCYEQALPRKPALAGRLLVSFAILPQGNVAAAAIAQDTLGDAAVAHCVTQATQRWSFPQPDGGGLVKVTYPFSFAPAGGAE